MKRIAFLGYNELDGNPVANGIKRVAYNQAQILKQRGYEVFYYELFSREQFDGLKSFLSENEIDVAIWHMSTLKIKGRLCHPCPLICLWHSMPNYQQDISEFCDKYHIWPCVSEIMKTKAFQWLFYKIHDLYKTLIYTYITIKTDKFVLLSERFKPVFPPVKLFPNKVSAISNFVDEELLDMEVDYDMKGNEVLFMGRLENKTKRIDLLLKVWEKIEYKYFVKNWVLNICGDGRDKKMLVQMKDDLGLKNVRFLGFVSPEEWFKKASVFCMTSAIEGMPMVLIEAAAYGCVPMAFNAFESASDLITDDVNGRLIEAFDIDVYAEALFELISNEDNRNRMAFNAKRDVKRFNPEKIMDEWEKLFDEAQQKKNK